MATITKKELIDRIADREGLKRVLVKRVIQTFLDSIVEELGSGNRLEFRDFGVFESKIRAARQAQNPKTMDKVEVPSRRTVKFKVGRVMKMRLHEMSASIDEATGLAVEASAQRLPKRRASGDGAVSPAARRTR
ncbi:MAG: HU family DNA-binding protein [Phycisphaerae bacterium]